MISITHEKMVERFEEMWGSYNDSEGPLAREFMIKEIMLFLSAVVCELTDGVENKEKSNASKRNYSDTLGDFGWEGF